jgi:HEAT repeat protein
VAYARNLDEGWDACSPDSLEMEVLRTPFVLDLLNDREPMVRLDAADTLVYLEGQTHVALRVFVELLGEGNPEVRRRTCNALKYHKGNLAVAPVVTELDLAAPAVMKLLKDEDEDVREAATEALAELGGPSAAPDEE